MGKVPGIASGYREAPAAFIGDHQTRVRKRTSHMWVGPDYSIVHPGIFPHNPKAAELATLEEWIAFDHQAGWGTDSFEDKVADEDVFPERWEYPDDRYEAREIIEDQLAHLDEINNHRLVLLRNGYKLGDLKIRKLSRRGLDFSIEVKNGTDGHNVPTGFDVERLVFLQVTVRDNEGAVLFRSGDRDPNGDVRDLHSLYVRHGEVPRDKYLFNLQSKFLVRNLHGAEREQVLAINESLDPLPFIRPSPFANILTGRPGDVRKQNMAIPPGASRWARYKIPRKALTGSEPYRLTIKLIAQMVPVNLVHEIHEVGFDYNMSSRDVAEAIVDKALILYDIETVLEEEGSIPLLPRSMTWMNPDSTNLLSP